MNGGSNKLSENEINYKLSLISDIDMMKYGWVSKVAKILNISHTHARRFVKKYYDKEIFKRL